jgi:Cu+-exporting ATPase
MSNSRQNLFFALIYNALGVLLAGGALYPLFHGLQNQMIAAAMSFSSVSVITNALPPCGSYERTLYEDQK